MTPDFMAVSAIAAARTAEGRTAFHDLEARGWQAARNGPISRRLEALLEATRAAGRLDWCEDFPDPTHGSYWTPSQPDLLRCHTCLAKVLPKPDAADPARVCDGCDQIVEMTVPVIAFVDAQILLTPDPHVLGPVIAPFVLCEACWSIEAGTLTRDRA